MEDVAPRGTGHLDPRQLPDTLNPITYFKLTLQKNNVALLGDACHPSLPYQAQGAAMAVEDGAVLATLLGLYQQAMQQVDDAAPKRQLTVPNILRSYEALQKIRTTTMQRGSVENQHVYHIADGAAQRARDEILGAATWREKAPGEAEPFIWIDVRYQKAIVGRDTIEDAGTVWEELISLEHGGEGRIVS